MTLLFVYGTLMRGERNHDYIREARFLEPSATAPAYSLYDIRKYDYPALLAEGTTSVAGELYEVSAETLAALDLLEESPEYYFRAEIALADGRKAQGYLLPPADLEGGTLIPSGDWRAREGGKPRPYSGNE